MSPAFASQYLGVLVTANYKTDAQPVVPTSSCPCWVTPDAAGQCPGIKVPITLQTLPLTANDSVTYQQCIDPANFDYL